MYFFKKIVKIYNINTFIKGYEHAFYTTSYNYNVTGIIGNYSV